MMDGRDRVWAVSATVGALRSLWGGAVCGRVRRSWVRVGLAAALLIFLCLVPRNLAAQGAAEHAVSTATVSGGATQAKTTKKIVTTMGAKRPSEHLQVRATEAPEVKNRRALEEQAGEDAGKLLLRSVPSRVQVWIDGKLVGRTPLLLILPPGSYKVAMWGPRMHFAEEEIDLLPEEIREFVLALAPRYPAYLRLR